MVCARYLVRFMVIPEEVELLSHNSETSVLGNVNAEAGGHIACVEQVLHFATNVRHLVRHLLDVLLVLQSIAVSAS